MMNIFKPFLNFNPQLKKESQDPQALVPKQPLNVAITFIAGLVILILDHSGSMDSDDYPPTRLQAAIDSAIEYVQTLVRQGSDVDVAVVAFGHRAEVVIAPTKIDESKKIIKAIRSITIDEGTDIAKGLKQAEKIIRQFSITPIQNQIILLTDGFGGHPVSIAEKLKTHHGSIIDVIGIGGSHSDVNELLLRKLATTDPDGTNHYRFIKDSGTLKKHYHQLASGLVMRGTK